MLGIKVWDFIPNKDDFQKSSRNFPLYANFSHLLILHKYYFAFERSKWLMMFFHLSFDSFNLPIRQKLIKIGIWRKQRRHFFASLPNGYFFHFFSKNCIFLFLSIGLGSCLALLLLCLETAKHRLQRLGISSLYMLLRD